MSLSLSLAAIDGYDRPTLDDALSVELTHADGTNVLILAERLPRGTPVKVRSADARRLTALLTRAADDDATPDAGERDCAGNCELCSAHFISGKGWAWRVTAALARARGKESAAAPTRRA